MLDIAPDLQNLVDNRPYLNTIYHYCSWQSFQSIIENKNIRLNDVAYMNDGAELTWFRDKLFHHLVNEASIKDRDALNYWWNFFEQTTHPTSTYLASFSKRADDLSMWRSYADDAHGVCVGFDPKYFDFKYASGNFTASMHSKDSLGIGEVIYNESRVENLIHRVKGIFSNLCEHGTNGEKTFHYQLALQDEARRYMHLVKHPSFSHEEEVRVTFITSIGSYGHNVDQKPIAMGAPSAYRAISSRNSLKLFFELGFNEYRDTQPIKEIVIGPKSHTHPKTLDVFLKSNSLLVNDIRESASTYK